MRGMGCIAVVIAAVWPVGRVKWVKWSDFVDLRRIWASRTMVEAPRMFISEVSGVAWTRMDYPEGP